MGKQRNEKKKKKNKNNYLNGRPKSNVSVIHYK